MNRWKPALFFVIATALLSIGWKSAPSSTAGRTDFGKIYLTPTHLLVSELYKGINIYDVGTPATIHSVGYIDLDGNFDVAVTGNTLYADSYEDLYVFDFSDPAHPVLVDSVLDVFASVQRPSTIEQRVVEDSYGGLSSCGSAAGCGNVESTSPMYDGGGRTGGNGGGGQTGQAGSMARFSIVDNYLYCIDQTNLIVFDIREPRKPSLVARVQIGFGIETLFTYEYYLFIGSSTGMFIYDARDIRVPIKVAEFRHARACDPVVVEGKRAYVTLKSGPICGPADDGLHIVDITNVTQPTLLVEHRMESPAGLSVVEGIAYVCDGSAVRILDVRNEAAIKELSSIVLGNTYDVILSEGLLYIVAPNGIYIYDVHDPAAPVKVAHISNVT